MVRNFRPYRKTVKHHGAQQHRPRHPRPMPSRPGWEQMTTLATQVTRVTLPDNGAFNAGMVTIPDSDDYYMAYRPNEYGFKICRLGPDLQVRHNHFFKFSIGNCADPRLIWMPDGRLLMVYSSISEGGIARECIRGAVVLDPRKSDTFIDAKPFRISPRGDFRNKNWMPFIYDGRIWLVANVCPHIVYEFIAEDRDVAAEYRHETPWVSPWCYPGHPRGNAQAVQLDDGTYLGTMHTAVHQGGCVYYDNGAYVFEGQPPFRVLKCANRPYLRAEDAIEPPFRKAGEIRCTFPVGMVRKGERLLISYGDGDSCVKVMETTVQQMLDLMVAVP